VLSTGVAGNYNGALQVVRVLTLIMWNAWLVRRDLLILKMGHVHWSVDVSGISGAFATGADKGELLREVLQAER
jgi:hypothetical protein